jgi:hypothetical protein
MNRSKISNDLVVAKILIVPVFILITLVNWLVNPLTLDTIIYSILLLSLMYMLLLSLKRVSFNEEYLYIGTTAKEKAVPIKDLYFIGPANIQLSHINIWIIKYTDKASNIKVWFYPKNMNQIYALQKLVGN